MPYIPKIDFGWSRRTGWLHGDEAAYDSCVRMWANRPKGRERTRPIHPSWEEVLKLFNPNDKERSQGAFCRWAGINRASFSSKQVKPLGDDMERFILEWDAKGKEVKNG
jgi:hypothetical protein